MMNNLHGVLMRFRNDYVGAQGDIKKMYYMVRIAVEEQFMQLFLWRFLVTIKSALSARVVW